MSRRRQLVLERLERGDQADQPQLGRMQTVREVVDALGETVRAVHGFGRELLALVAAGTAQQLEIDRRAAPSAG